MCEPRSPLQWASVPRWAPGEDGNLWRDSWRMVSRRLQRLLCDRPSFAPPPPPHLGAGPAPRASEAPTVGDQAPPPDGGAGSPRAPPHPAPPAARALRTTGSPADPLPLPPPPVRPRMLWAEERRAAEGAARGKSPLFLAPSSLAPPSAGGVAQRRGTFRRDPPCAGDVCGPCRCVSRTVLSVGVTARGSGRLCTCRATLSAAGEEAAGPPEAEHRLPRTHRDSALSSEL